jgi:DNA anti-recombination protein RmuC
MAEKTKTKTQRKRPDVNVDPVEQVAVVTASDMMRWTVRLEESIGKLATATTALSVGVAEHTQRLNHVENQYAQQQIDYRSMQASHSEDYKELNSRIGTVQRELSENIGTVQNQLTEKISDNTAQVKDHIDTSLQKFIQDRIIVTNDLSTRIDTLEKWRWLIIGGAGVSVVLLLEILKNVIGKINWATFIK